MKPLLHALGRGAVALAVALLTACASTRPWVNLPLDASAPVQPVPALEPMLPVQADARLPSVVAAVALSGGGARAAAFGLGVIEEMKATRLRIGGRSTTLLDEVGLISGVSGGSVLATYYAAFGDEVFTRFEAEFLQADFQRGLVGQLLSPAGLYRLSSPWYGRSNVLAQRLDSLYRGLSFGDLAARRGGPRLLVTATDLTTGAPFEFTPEQFALICSGLDRVPLSFAVAASSAVPVLLSPLTLRNHAGSCRQPAPRAQPAPASDNLSAQLLRMVASSYQDARQRPFLHLVDGGLVDNLGVRGLLERIVAGGPLRHSFAHLPPRSVHRVVLVSVNSERDLGDRLDDSDRVPTIAQVLDALVFGAGSRATAETSAMVLATARRLAAELEAERGSDGSPFAADAELHVVSVRLRDMPDDGARDELLQVPTAFSILPLQVRQLREAGRRTLRESPEYQQLLRSLRQADDEAPVQAGLADAAGALPGPAEADGARGLRQGR